MSLVSIIMPYYKKELYIESSIKSILSQTYKNFEIIIINDDLTESSHNLLNEISKLDNRIHVLINEKNLGTGVSRNKGISIAKGEYIAFCDCDDLWSYEKLELQLNFMKKTGANFTFSSYEIINEQNIKIGERIAQSNITYNQLINSCDIGLSTVLIKKKIFDEKEYRFPNLTTKEDYVLWLMLAKNGIKMIGINQNLTRWRKSNNSLSSSTLQKLVDGFRVYHTYMKFGVVKSLFYLARLSLNFILKK